jgi:CBS domain-containing protein
MSSPVISVREDTPVETAIALIRERKIHRVVVTVADGGRERPIGILSVSDVVGRLGRIGGAPGSIAPMDGRLR